MAWGNMGRRSACQRSNLKVNIPSGILLNGASTGFCKRQSLFGVVSVYVAGSVLGIGEQFGHRRVCRFGTLPVEPRISLVPGIEGPGEPLPAVVVGCIERDQLTHLHPPVLAAGLAEGGEEIEAPQHLAQMLQLRLIERIDCEDRPATQQNRNQQHRKERTLHAASLRGWAAILEGARRVNRLD